MLLEFSLPALKRKPEATSEPAQITWVHPQGSGVCGWDPGICISLNFLGDTVSTPMEPTCGPIALALGREDLSFEDNCFLYVNASRFPGLPQGGTTVGWLETIYIDHLTAGDVWNHGGGGCVLKVCYKTFVPCLAAT
jgi:hypothetical protein